MSSDDVVEEDLGTYSAAFADLMAEAEEHAHHLIKESANAPKDMYEEWQGG
jgi:hypothetical protein